MPLITLYRPDGGTEEYQNATEFSIGAGIITFINRPADTPTKGKKVITSLPFLYEEPKDIPLGH